MTNLSPFPSHQTIDSLRFVWAAFARVRKSVLLLLLDVVDENGMISGVNSPCGDAYGVISAGYKDIPTKRAIMVDWHLCFVHIYGSLSAPVDFSLMDKELGFFVSHNERMGRLEGSVDLKLMKPHPHKHLYAYGDDAYELDHLI